MSLISTEMGDKRKQSLLHCTWSRSLSDVPPVIFKDGSPFSQEIRKPGLPQSINQPQAKGSKGYLANVCGKWKVQTVWLHAPMAASELEGKPEKAYWLTLWRPSRNAPGWCYHQVFTDLTPSTQDTVFRSPSVVLSLIPGFAPRSFPAPYCSHCNMSRSFFPSKPSEGLWGLPQSLLCSQIQSKWGLCLKRHSPES